MPRPLPRTPAAASRTSARPPSHHSCGEKEKDRLNHIHIQRRFPKDSFNDIHIHHRFLLCRPGSPCYPPAAALGAHPGAGGARTTSVRRTRSWTRTARLGKRFNDIHIQHLKPPTVLPSSHSLPLRIPRRTRKARAASHAPPPPLSRWGCRRGGAWGRTRPTRTLRSSQNPTRARGTREGNELAFSRARCTGGAPELSRPFQNDRSRPRPPASHGANPSPTFSLERMSRDAACSSSPISTPWPCPLGSAPRAAPGGALRGARPSSPTTSSWNSARLEGRRCVQ